MSKISSAEIESLTAAHDWGVLSERLVAAAADGPPASRVAYLAHLSMVRRVAGDLEGAKASALQAFDLLREAPQGSFAAGYYQGLAQRLEEAQEPATSLRVLELTETSASLPPDLQTMKRRLRAAIANASELRSSRVRIVALGQNCIPDDLCARWGLAGISVGGPFSAGVFRGDGAAVALETDFASFSHVEDQRVANTAAGLKSLMIPKYQCFLNHEVGPYWFEGDGERVRTYYLDRIQKFRETLKRPYVVYVHMRETGSSVARLWALLNKLAPNQRKELLIFDFAGEKAPIEKGLDFRIRVVPTAMPYGTAENVWFRSSSFNSEVGFNWERSLVDTILKSVKRLAK
jgi:hypothetical protein